MRSHDRRPRSSLQASSWVDKLRVFRPQFVVVLGSSCHFLAIEPALGRLAPLAAFGAVVASLRIIGGLGASSLVLPRGVAACAAMGAWPWVAGRSLPDAATA